MPDAVRLEALPPWRVLMPPLTAGDVFAKLAQAAIATLRTQIH